MKLLKVLVTLLLFVIGIPILTWACGFAYFAASISALKTPIPLTHADAAIVLTGGSNRVGAGFDLLSDGHIDSLLISGVGKKTTRKELIKEISYKKKLPDCCITLGHEAENTIGNAAEAQKWLWQHKSMTAYIVTSNYHMPRALLEFHHADPKITFIPFPVQPDEFDSQNELFWKLSFLEYHKYLVTLFRINLYPEEKNPIPQVLKK